MDVPSNLPDMKGNLVDGVWFCHCGLRAKWLTSKKDTSYGRRFLRCSRADFDQCKFFVWEDEAAERKSSAASQSLTVDPILVSSGNGIPRPGWAKGGELAMRLLQAGTLDGVKQGSSLPQLLSEDSSLSPSQNKDKVIDPDLDESMTKDILKLLRSGDVVLKASTRIQLRHIINTGVKVYQLRLERVSETFSEFQQKLDELEILYCKAISKEEV